LNTVCRLNRSGRSYLKTEPTNKRLGCDVLGAVSDDMDCLFFHLRENPLLCKLDGPFALQQEVSMVLK
jgi:hypothetical protein